MYKIKKLLAGLVCCIGIILTCWGIVLVLKHYPLAIGLVLFTFSSWFVGELIYEG